MTKLNRVTGAMQIITIAFCVSCLPAALTAQSNMLKFIRKIKVDHQGSAGACDGSAFNTEGNIIAASDNTGLTKLFNVADGSLISVIKHNEGEVSASHGETNVIHFTQDDQYAVTGMNSTGAKIWDLKTGKMVKNLGHGQNTDGAAFSPNGKWIAAAHDRFLAVYTLWDFKKRAEFSVPKQETNSVDWSSDASLLMLGGDGATVKIVRTEDWKVLHHILFPYNRVKTVRFSPDNQFAAASGQNGLVRVYNTSDGRIVANLEHESTARALPGDDDDGDQPNVESFAWSPDGKYLFSGGVYDGIIRVWRAADWSLIGWVQGQEYSRQIETVSMSQDNLLASGGDEGYVYLFQFIPPVEKKIIRQQGNELISIEGEDFDANVPQGGHWWTVVDDEKASGKKRMQCFPDLSQDKKGVISEYVTHDPMRDGAKLDYRVHFDTPGVYHIWARGQSSDHYGNSFHVGLHGDALSTADKLECLGENDEWVWAKTTKDKVPATIEIKKAGPVTINIWPREDGIQIDKLVLTLDEAFKPEGLGPEATQRR